MEKIYFKNLEELKNLSEKIPNTPMMAKAKINVLIKLNMRYEKIMLNRKLKIHPYELVKSLINDAISDLIQWSEISFIENPKTEQLKRKEMALETSHHNLFQQLWVKFSEKDYEDRIHRYLHRLKINGLSKGWLKGFKCIDLGCGHGNFAHALIQEGAKYVYGIDFGEGNIKYAKSARKALGVKPSQIEFKMESVYKINKPNNYFDFAIQNGVFHHLDDENRAYKEAFRVLKPDGWFWIYSDGAGGISYDLWDSSVFILRNIPQEFTIYYLESLNIETGKRYHLGDGLNAIYRHTTYEELSARLAGIGFKNFRRLVGGFPTDFDHDVIAADKYGKEKFGAGDIRILAQKKA